MNRFAVLLLTVLTTAVTAVTAHAQVTEWLRLAVAPVTEKMLMEPGTRWPTIRIVADDSLREMVLRNAGYAGSTGPVNDRIGMVNLTETVDSMVTPAITYTLFLIKGIDGERDDALWLVSRTTSGIVARTLVGHLLATCESTYVRGCIMSEKDVIEIQQIQHQFDCEKDQFLRTDILPTFHVRVLPDGHFEDIIDDH